MSRIISIHSFRGGTGKSNTTANVAALLAAEGLRIGVVDTDIQSPGIHVLFGVDQQTLSHSLNDYLWGNCSIEQSAYDVTTPGLDGGRVFLIPSSIKPADIARVMREGYDVGLLNEGFRHLIEELELDALLLDTHPGLNEETLLSIAMSNALAVIMRPDSQDYEGTSVTAAEVQARVEKTYDCEVAAVLPHSDELMVLSSEGIFALRHPDHPLTGLYRQIASRIMS